VRNAIGRSTLAPAMLAIGSAVLAPSLAQAQDDGYDFKMFAGGAYVSPLSDSSLSGIADSVEASSEFGWEIGAEWKPSDRFGFELAYLDANHDVEADGTTIGDISFRPWNLSLNFHVVNRDAFNWYIGPTVSYIDWSEVELVGGGSLDVDSETAYGVSTGLAIGLGDTFAIQFGLRYIDASVDSAALPDEVDVDPLFTSVGFAFRF
jgi:outer membrane protein W